MLPSEDRPFGGDENEESMARKSSQMIGSSLTLKQVK